MEQQTFDWSPVRSVLPAVLSIQHGEKVVQPQQEPDAGAIDKLVRTDLMLAPLGFGAQHIRDPDLIGSRLGITARRHLDLNVQTLPSTA